MKKSILSLSATVLLLASCGGGMSFEDAAKWVESHYVGEGQKTIATGKWEWDFSMANGSAARFFAAKIIEETTGYTVRTVDELKSSFEFTFDPPYVNKLTVTNFRMKYDPNNQKDSKYTYKVEQECLNVFVEHTENMDGGTVTVIGGDYYDKEGFQTYTDLKLPKCTFPDGSNCNNGFLKQSIIS